MRKRRGLGWMGLLLLLSGSIAGGQEAGDDETENPSAATTEASVKPAPAEEKPKAPSVPETPGEPTSPVGEPPSRTAEEAPETSAQGEEGPPPQKPEEGEIPIPAEGAPETSAQEEGPPPVPAAPTGGEEPEKRPLERPAGVSVEEVEIEKKRAEIAATRLERAKKLEEESTKKVVAVEKQIEQLQKELERAEVEPEAIPPEQRTQLQQQLEEVKKKRETVLTEKARARELVQAAQQEVQERQSTIQEIQRRAQVELLQAEAARVEAAVKREIERYTADQQKAEEALQKAQADLEAAQAELETAPPEGQALVNLKVALAKAQEGRAQSQLELAEERLEAAHLRLAFAKRRAEIAEQRQSLKKGSLSHGAIRQQAGTTKQNLQELERRLLLLGKKKELVQESLELLAEGVFPEEADWAKQAGAEGTTYLEQVQQARGDRRTALQDLLEVLQSEETLARESHGDETAWDALIGTRYLWHRRERNISRETFRNLLTDVRRGADGVRNWVGTLPGRLGTGWSDPLVRRQWIQVLLVLLAVVGLGFLVHLVPLRLLTQYRHRWETEAGENPGARWLVALSNGALVGLRWGLALGGILLVVQAAHPSSQLSRACWHLALIIFLYRLALGVSRALFFPYHPQWRPFQCSDDTALHAHTWLSRLLLCSLLFLPVLWLMSDLGYGRRDVFVLVRLVYQGLMLLLVLVAVGRRKAWLGFLPRADDPRVEVAVHLLHPLAIVYLLFLLMMYSLGYGNFINYCLKGTVLSLAVLALIPTLRRLLHGLLAWGVSRIGGDRVAVPVEGSPAQWLYHRLRPGLPYLTGILVGSAILLSWGFSPPEVVVRLLKGLRYLIHRPFNPGSEKEISLWSILLAFLYVIAAFLVSKYLRRGLQRFVFNHPRVAWDRGVQHAILTGLHYALIVFAALKGLQSLGMSLADLTVLSAAFGVGLGFGLQDIFKNFVSGAIVLVERPIKIGDYVNVAGTLGNVRNISTRSTTIITPDDTALIVPNATFVTTNITNWSYGGANAKLHVTVNVTNKVDMVTVRKTILQVLRNVEGVLREPAPQVLCTALTVGGFSFDLQVWTRTPERSQEIISHINFALEEAFQKAGIELK